MVISKFTRPLISLCLITIAVFVTTSSSAGALGGDGLRVSPVRSDITISPGQSQTLEVSVTNVQTIPASLQAVVNDFTASTDESGNPAVIVNANQYAPSHSLKRFVVPITSTINVAPGETVQVPVTIKVPADATGGGYYGLVRFAPAGSTAVAGKNLTLAGSVGSLILLTVPGNIVDKLSIVSFDIESGGSAKTLFFSNKNINAVVRFNNQGNIQEQPFGKVLLKSHGNKELAAIEVNNAQPRGDVLPGSIRKFTVPLTHIGSFGIFTVEGNFGYGPNGTLISAATTFYVIPVFIIIIFIAIVLLLLFLIFILPKLIKAYNKRIITRAARRGNR